ncbi:GNL3L/Grn1 putative GTPase-domain-containing protein [Russula brevipes]|nr:GNL3L/Grn1 putative GTPase-domain-containing protein [Russula brevipes]
MPRIRKKTSKRGTTARRAKVKHKVAEGRKKSKKAAKKDSTWKSKKSKDPGIPNNFPYKEQILAEIAEERRQAAEVKTRRKEEKKNLRAQQKALEANGKEDGDDSGGEGSGEAGDEEGDIGSVAVATLGGRTKKGSSKSTKDERAADSTSPSASASTAEAGSGAPQLLNPDLPHLAAVLDKADVVIQVLDARDPLAHRSTALEARVASKEGQRLLLVLNKIDTCPREPTAAWAGHLRSEHPTLLFRVASSFLPSASMHDPTKRKGKGKEPSDDAWGSDAVSELLGLWAQEKTGEDPLHVAIVGVTNSGKSAFINSLARKAILDGKPVVFIDTPGLFWQHSEEASPEERTRRRALDVLLRSKGRVDRLKDPMPAVSCIVSRAETEDLMVLYSLPAFAKGDVDAFLGGNPDLATAARLVLRDWLTAKLSRYAVPPAVSGPGTTVDTVPPSLAAIYAADAALLERLPPRKELRRSCDLVRLSSERVDDRVLAFEAPWFGADTADGNSDVEHDNEGAGEGEAIRSGTEDNEEEDSADEAGLAEGAESGFDRLECSSSLSEEESDEGDGDEDEEEAPPKARSSPARKRKRPPSPAPASVPSMTRKDPAARPSKKVAFAALPSTKTTTAKPLVRPRPSIATRDKMQKKKNNTLLLSSPPARGTNTPSSKKTDAKVRVASAHLPAREPSRSRTRKPAANAPTTMAPKRKQAAGVGDEDTYDFGNSSKSIPKQKREQIYI